FLVDGTSNIVTATAGSGFITDGAWHHVIAQRSGDTVELYVDGVLADSTSNSIGTVTSTEPLRIGGSTNDDYEGFLDDVRGYSRALRAADITALYALSGGTIGGGGGYSDPSGSNNSSEWITNVTFAGINNSTGQDANAYGDYTAQTGNVTQGQTNTLSVTIQDDDDNDITAWIDWNQDGDFSDAGEEYVIVAGTTVTGPHTIDITTPNDATIGTTRMRIGMAWQSPPSPDGGGGFGEYEDYTINVSASGPQTFTVTNTLDDGSVGSLRWAIQQANANAGADTIDFNIAGSGTQVINLSSQLDITDQVTIDGTTQAGWTEGSFLPIVIDGGSSGINGLNFTATADGSEIRGLVIRDFTFVAVEIADEADNITVAGNWFGQFNSDGSDASDGEQSWIGIRSRGDNVVIGGTTVANRNVFSGDDYGVIVRGTSTGTTVSGNYFGTAIDGNSVLGDSRYGILLQDDATGNTFGGATSARANVLVGSSVYTITAGGEGVDGNTFQNNIIGASADRSTQLDFNTGTASGIYITGGGDNNQIIDNLIVGSASAGIELDASGVSDGTIIQGNIIGTDATGTQNWGVGETGILIENATNTTIGGIGAGDGNVIAYSGRVDANLGVGIAIQDGGSGNTIRGNSIYGNSIQGIDLSAGTAIDGPTANDAGDVDSGSNNLQNWAVLSSAAIADDGTFSYDLDTTTLAGGTYTIDFYASTDRDGGQVEGQRYLGSLTGVADGNSSLTGSLSGITLASGEYVTLVTTDASGNSSEFSNYAVATDSDPGGAAPSDIATTATSEGGLSINEDGGNDIYLHADDGSSILGNRTAFTAEFQFSMSSVTSWGTLLSYAVPGNDNELTVNVDSSGQVALIVDGQTRRTTNGFPELLDGSTNSIAVRWDNSGNSSIFVNGVLRESFTNQATGATLETGGELVLGQEQDDVLSGFRTNERLSGTLHDVRVFDGLRTAEQIEASYRSDLPFDEAGLVANWKFDQLSSDGVITDTVSGNNLTLNHVRDASFTASEATLTFGVDENAIDGTVVGSVSANDAEREAQIASLLAADPDLRYSAETGKFYKLTSTTAVDWAGAGSAASSETLGGVTSQLVTIRSAHENSLVTEFANASGVSNVWLNATDETVEGEWRWLDDSSLFWQGDENGYAVDHSYANWENTQPNGVGVGDYAYVIVATGEWWDFTSADTASVLVEWNADDVLDATQAITYSIQSQSVAGAFEIDADTGEIRVADGTLLDADTLATHTITVRSTDVDSNTVDEDFTISLNNLVEDNNAPSDLSSGIELNTDGGNDAYLQASDGGAVLGSLTEFTFETSFQISDGDQPSFLSYATGSQQNEVLMFVRSNGFLSIGINGTIPSTDIMLSDLNDGQPHTLAWSWDNTNGDWHIYLDGELADSGTNLQAGHTIGTGGTLIFGQEQDSQGGGFESTEAFQGTLYDVRIWNDVRSEAEISLNYQQKLDSSSIPSGLVANWQMEFNGSNEVVDIVSESGTPNRLSMGHATGTGFTASTPVDDLHISENAVEGASVGFVVPSDLDSPQDVVEDGMFTEAGATGYVNVGNGQTIGGTSGSWTVVEGNVDLEGGWADSPLGGTALGLDGSVPGAIQQTLTTEAGRQYQVIFALTGNFQGGNTHDSLRVSAAGESADFDVTMPTGWTTSNLLWEHRSFTFTATDAPTDLRFASLSPSGGLGPVIGDVQVIEIPQAVSTILNNDATLSYDAATGKFYRFVSSTSSFSDALSSAIGSSLNGVSGELVTIGSAYENDLIRQHVLETGTAVWLGITDAASEGTWVEYRGNTADGDVVFTGGAAAAGQYANANDLDGVGGEDHARMVSDGTWADINDTVGNHDHVVQWDASEVLSSFTFNLTDDAGGRFAIDSSTGEITVADGSLIDYETAMSHNVDVQVTDAAGNSYTEIMSITVDNEVDANQTVPGPQTIDEDTTLTFTSGTATEVSVSDSVAATDAHMRVTLSVNDGVLFLSQTTGITFVENVHGNSSFVIEGTESAINAALDGMTFQANAEFSGNVTLTMTTAIAADLEGHYTFTGGSADDQAAGTVHDGTFVGNATTTFDPERGEVLSLDGNGDRVEISGNFGEPTDITLAAWVNLTSPDTLGAEVISLGDNVYLRLDGSGAGTNGIAFTFRDGSTWQEVNSGVFIAGTGWQHVAATFDDVNNTQTIYLNGEVIATGNFTSSIAYDQEPNTYIGRNGNNNSAFDFNGLIDDARVYSRALSAEEIAAIAGEQVVGSGPAVTVGPDLTQTFGDTNGDGSAANLLFIHDDFGGITSTGTISNLQIGPDSDSTPIDFDLLVLRPSGGDFDVVHRVSLTDSDIVSTDGNGVRTLDIGTLNVQAGDVVAHWSANSGGSIPYSLASGGSTGWSTYSSGDLDVGDTVQESLDSTLGRVYGLNFTFEPSNTNLQTSDSVNITVNPINDAPTFGVGPGISNEDFPGGNANEYAEEVIALADGSSLTAGNVFVNGSRAWAITKWTADGSLDTSFGTDGVYINEFGTGNDLAKSIVEQADGKLVIGGYVQNTDRDFAVMRLNADGSVDNDFGVSGFVFADFGTSDSGNDIAIQSDGNILITGGSNADSDIRVVRLSGVDGGLDNSFGTNGIATIDLGGANDDATSVAVDGSGRIILGGFTSGGAFVARLSSSGALDTTFGSPNGYATTNFGGAGVNYVEQVIVQSDGSYVLVGNSFDYSLEPDEYEAIGIARFTSTGALDTGFGENGVVRQLVNGENSYSIGRDVVQQSDGKLIVIGTATPTSTGEAAIFRYNTDGTLDTSFGDNGTVLVPRGFDWSEAYGVDVASDGTILVAGYGAYGGSSDYDTTVWRYNSTGTLIAGEGSGRVNDSPTFVEGSAAVVLDTDVFVFDRELSASENFNGSSLTLVRNGGANVEDVFSATGLLGALTESGSLVYDSTTIGTVTTNSGGSLVLSFNASATNELVNNALRSIAYSNTSDAPPATLQIDWTFDDGGDSVQIQGGSAEQATGSTIVSIIDVPNPATVVVPTAQTVDEDVPLVFTGPNAITVDNGSPFNPIMTTTISVSNGTLTLDSTIGITFLNGTNNGEAVLTFSGLESDVNAALDGMEYLGTQDFNGADTLTITTGATPAVDVNIYARYEFFQGATTDQSGNGYDGDNVVGDPTLTADPDRGDVMTFDGDDRIQVTNGISGLNNEVTISAWVNLDAGQQESTFLSLGDEVYIVLDPTNTSQGIGGRTGSFTSYSLDSNDRVAGTGWRHIALSLDITNNVLRVYLDGQLTRESSNSFVDADWLTAPSQDIIIGGLSDGSRAFVGSIDDARVYDRVLTETEIIEVMGDHGFDTESTGITVNAVNDAPTFTALPTVNEAIIDNSVTSGSVVGSGDLDNDGDLDLIAASSNGEILWYSNDGDGGFGTGTSLFNTAGYNFTSIATGDLDGDGDLDFVVTNETPDNSEDGLLIFDNQWIESGNATFGMSSMESDLFDAYEVAIADVDGDTRLDLVVSFGSGDIAIYEQNAPDVFTRSLAGTVTGARGLDVGDLDGDGHLDIAVAGSTGVFWLENDTAANPTFTLRTASTLTTIQDVVIDNFDGDSDLDIGYLRSQVFSTQVGWLENDGAATPNFTQNTISTLGSFSTFGNLISGDFDGANGNDLAISISNGVDLRIFHNDGIGTFTEDSQ
ncbi:MAG: LamG-like jellyroll fold domain-containing protein, partial [Planctomycetota bacterium]